MTNTTAARVSAMLGFLAVVLGAAGAHGLNQLLDKNHTLQIWEKAVFYHFIHAVMLFLLSGRPRLALGPWFAFLIGIILFSGSLYVLALTNIKWLGAITPFGGISFLAGWLWLATKPIAGHDAKSL